MTEYDAIVVGAGLSGSVIARYLAEEHDKKVLVVERRDHIGGNMYDYYEDGLLVQKYGPHTFHTKKEELFRYMEKYAEWEPYKLTCGAVIDGKYTPTPFNYTTIDTFFGDVKAKEIKNAIEKEYSGKEFATVLEMLNHSNENIKEYAEFLFEKDYSLYTAKQWGLKPDEIDPSILKRVPIRFNYEIGYFDDEYQYMPRESFTKFFENILNHKNISISLSHDIFMELRLDEDNHSIIIGGHQYNGLLVFTGEIDALFNYKYGKLPYRSLRFEWKKEKRKSFQEAPVVAYPQEEGFTRITEYTKLPVQRVEDKTIYAVEYSLPYREGTNYEPYYPVLTEESQNRYKRYRTEAEKFSNLLLCGRLADFKYYNMDQALEVAIAKTKELKERII